MRISGGRIVAGALAAASTLWIAGASLPLHAHGTEARRVELLSWTRDRIVRVVLVVRERVVGQRLRVGRRRSERGENEPNE